MNAPANIKTARTEQLNAWFSRSGIAHCTTCDGLGRVRSQARPSVWNPYPETRCDDCGGHEGPCQCEVCGSTVEVRGYDCIVCQMVLELAPDQLDDATAAELANAVVRAVAVAAAHRAKVAA